MNTKAPSGRMLRAGAAVVTPAAVTGVAYRCLAATHTQHVSRRAHHRATVGTMPCKLQGFTLDLVFEMPGLATDAGHLKGEFGQPNHAHEIKAYSSLPGVVIGHESSRNVSAAFYEK